MWGERTANNCYGLPGLTTNPQIFCNKATIDDNELWHRSLEHLNFFDMLKIASREIVKDLPKMEKIGKGICGACQLGKQTRAAHKKTSGIHTSKNLEGTNLLQPPNFFFFITTSCWQMTRSLSQVEHNVQNMAHTPMAFQRDSNLLPSRGLVRISANWFSVGMNESETTSDSTRSRESDV
jgi:hypothetical protein